MREHDIIINEDGSIQMIHDDDLVAALAAEGLVTTRRASHVEPVRVYADMAATPAGLWEADMSPVGGPVLGPFPTRQAALDAEVAWLREEMTRRTV